MSGVTIVNLEADMAGDLEKIVITFSLSIIFHFHEKLQKEDVL